MKSKTVFLSLVLVLAIASAAAAQAPNFSGQWKMTSWKESPEREAGTFPDLTMDIKHESDRISMQTNFVNTPVDLPPVQRRYTTDGKESLNPAQGGGTLKAVARFENGTLIVEGETESIRATLSGGSEPDIQYERVHFREEMSLSEDGKTLTLVRKSETPEGLMTRTLTLTKVS